MRVRCRTCGRTGTTDAEPWIDHDWSRPGAHMDYEEVKESEELDLTFAKK